MKREPWKPRHSIAFMMRLLSTTALASVFATTAMAQNHGAAEQNSEPSKDSLQLETVIVTGVASGTMTKRDASFAISTLDSSQIDQIAPLHTGDLLNSTPGVLAENTGGDNGTNTFVRGFAQNSGSGFVTVQLNGLPIYPTSVAGFIENTAMFRLDESVDHMEALRGGSAVLLSNAQNGVTFNFLQKKGTDELHGIAKVSFTDYGLKRFDYQQSGPIDSKTFYSVGGFYRSSPGLRDAEYNGDYGGQIEFQLTRQIDRGELNIWGRYTNDHDNWYLPIPVSIGSNNKTPSGFSGFDWRYGTYQGNDNRFGVIETAPGQTLSLDSKDGRGVELGILGASVDKEFGDGWFLSAKAGFTSGIGDCVGPVGSGNPQTLESYIDQTIDTANANSAVTSAAGGLATGYTGLKYTGTGEAITDTSILVMPVDLWSVQMKFSSFVGDFRLSKQIGANKVTVGGYFADETYKDEWYLGNARLLTAEPHGKRIDFMLNNGVMPTHNGFVGTSYFVRNAGIDTQTWAMFLLDEWQVTPALRLEAGFRYEDRKYDGNTERTTSGSDFDGSILTLYDNAGVYLNGNFTPLSYKDSQVSWTAAVNYDFTDAVSTFARISSGGKFPDPDNIINGQLGVSNIDQYEAGLKVYTDQLSVFTTFFFNKFSNVPYFELLNGVEKLSTSGSQALGLEFEADYRPFENFDISVLGTWVDSQVQGGDYPGNRLYRQPEFATRITPKYHFDVFGYSGAAYGTIANYFGHRFSDNANLQPLGAYMTIDVGAYVDIYEGTSVRISADNLTNEMGLTERNPRTSGNGVTNSLTLGRPTFGRTVQASVEYRF